MALDSRDKWMLLIGSTMSFFLFSTLGRKMMMTAMGMGKAEIERALGKAETKAKKRAKGY